MGAGSPGGRPRCRRERSPASAAAASETRRLPRAPGARSGAAAAAAAGSRAPLAGAGARSPPPATGQAGAAARGPARGGAGGRALGSGLRAGPAAACPERRARSAAAVTVCLCHVCAAGGDREPGSGSGRGRGQRAPRCPPPPRDGAAGQWQTPQPHGLRGLPRLGSASSREAPPFHFSGSLARGWKQHPEPESRPGSGGKRASWELPALLPPPRQLPAASGLASLAERGGREEGRVRSCRCRDAGRLAGPCSLSTPPCTKPPSWEVGSFPASTSTRVRRFFPRWAGYGEA